MPDQPIRLDDDGFLDMSTFPGGDPDLALPASTMASLRAALDANPEPRLGDDQWDEVLDATFHAEPQDSAELVDLVGQLDEPADDLSDEGASGPIDLAGEVGYEGRSADHALASLRPAGAEGSDDRESTGDGISGIDEGLADRAPGDDGPLPTSWDDDVPIGETADTEVAVGLDDDQDGLDGILPTDDDLYQS